MVCERLEGRVGTRVCVYVCVCVCICLIVFVGPRKPPRNRKRRKITGHFLCPWRYF